MTHSYNITGMTCNGCLNSVKSLLSGIENVRQVDISLAEGTAEIIMDRHIPTPVLQGALKGNPKYRLNENYPHQDTLKKNQQLISWLITYKPLLLIFGYILLVAVIAANTGGPFMLMTAMRVFMGGFFLTFSFFKLLNLQGFAESYSMYDLIAKRWHSWGYVYAFIELGLGIAYLLNLAPLAVNAVTLATMSVSLAGVLQNVLNKKKIQCACLGTVFNLPMSAVTIAEDGLMILMSVFMLLSFFNLT